MKCFKRPLRWTHWAVHKFSSGLRGSKEEKWALKISSFWAPVNKSYRREFRKNSRKNHKGLSVHNWRDLRSYRCELEFLSADFDHGFEHETRCHKVCSPPAHTGPKRHSFDFVPGVEKSGWKWLKLSKVIRGDESWCYGYVPETKQAWSQWKTPTSPRPKKTIQVRSNVKRMLIVFFRCSRNRAPGIHSSCTDCQSGRLSEQTNWTDL